MKPRLLSIGVALPLFGLYGHWYVPCRRHWRLRSVNLWVARVTWTSYRRITDAPVP